MRTGVLCCSVLVFLHIIIWVSSLSPDTENIAAYKEMKQIGSRPPNCESKCYGCIPCVAIQVPTINGGRFSLLYANYFPEGWKCKCGTSFYTP